MIGKGEFSHRSRETALRRFDEETFDLLIIGGGITGAATARDAASRGLKVALVERQDFAYGTSSRSSKLIHGGLRYLENMEFGLVFEALSERTLLLKTVPHLVRPLPFFFPVYKGDPNGRGILSLGLWLYDLLALFRSPGFHTSLSKKKLLKEVPFLKEKGLLGGFRYFDASMWDDVLAVEILRDAQSRGAAVANYVEAVSPIWEEDRIRGFVVRDREQVEGRGEIRLRARRVVVCAGPWTDQVGMTLSPNWRRWLNPSKGVHLIFDLKRLPVPGALVMSHPEDGRIAFVIPRPDYGAGVTIVGTTDGPTPPEPDRAEIDPADVNYLVRLLQRYFPSLELKASDILSAYVGVRPLMGATASTAGSEGPAAGDAHADALQKVSREHYIGAGPGGTILVAGGKYTTHRKIAEEVVEETLEHWKKDHRAGFADPVPQGLRSPDTHTPVNPAAVASAVQALREKAAAEKRVLPEELISRYGAEADTVLKLAESVKLSQPDPAGFPALAAQLVFSMRSGMVVHLEDFFLRRVPLYAARADHGLPWAEELSRVWAREKGLGEVEAKAELSQLRAEFERRSAWSKNPGITGPSSTAQKS